jgi:hypothetical protein
MGKPIEHFIIEYDYEWRNWNVYVETEETSYDHLLRTDDLLAAVLELFMQMWKEMKGANR